MVKMSKCPKCDEEITHLDFDVTAGCSAQIYQEDVLNGKITDYDIDCLTDGVQFDNFRCPECQEKLFDTEDEAIKFLKE